MAARRRSHKRPPEVLALLIPSAAAAAAMVSPEPARLAARPRQAPIAVARSSARSPSPSTRRRRRLGGQAQGGVYEQAPARPPETCAFWTRRTFLRDSSTDVRPRPLFLCQTMKMSPPDPPRGMGSHPPSAPRRQAREQGAEQGAEQSREQSREHGAGPHVVVDDRPAVDRRGAAPPPPLHVLSNSPPSQVDDAAVWQPCPRARTMNESCSSCSACMRSDTPDTAPPLLC